jgi:hypothetical protein
MITPDEVLVWVPVIVPVVTGVVGLFLPSPGPAVVRWSGLWWANVARIAVKAFQTKEAQAVVATEVSPLTMAAINEAVRQTVAALPTAPVAPAAAAVPISVLGMGTPHV